MRNRLARNVPRAVTALGAAAGAGTRMCALASVVGILAGCAALVPERAPLAWQVEGVHREERPERGEVQWTYALVIDNAGRQSAKLFRQSVTLTWDGVSLTPLIEPVNHLVPARGKTRLAYVSIFSQRDFEAARPGEVGRALGAGRRVETMSIYWQFLGRYEDGAAIILNAEFMPYRSR